MTSGNLPDFDTHWDYGDPEGTEQRFRELLTLADEDSAYRAELLTQIARTHSLRQQFDDAHAILDEVDSNLQGTDMARPRIRALLERGRTFTSAGQPERGRLLFEQALDLAIRSGEDNLAVDAAHMIAIVAPPDETLDWNLHALGLAEQSSDPAARKWLGSLYNNIGWTYHKQGNLPLALSYLEMARDFRAEYDYGEGLLIARWCVARVWRDMGRTEDALREQIALSAEYADLGEPSGYVFEEIAECLLLMDRPEMARPYFAQAWELLSQDVWLVRDDPERLTRLQRLGAD